MADESRLTRPQRHMLARARERGPQVYDGRAVRAAEHLAYRGLADVTAREVTARDGVRTIWEITVTARPPETAGLCVIDGTPIDPDGGLCLCSCQPADRAQWVQEGSPAYWDAPVAAAAPAVLDLLDPGPSERQVMDWAEHDAHADSLDG